MVEIEPGLYMVGGTEMSEGELKMIDGWATCWYCQKSIPAGTLVTLAPVHPAHVSTIMPICGECREKRESDAL